MLIPTTPPANTFVMLRPGYSTNRIATELKAAGVIRNERAFVLWHYLHHRRSLKAGEYLFEKPASARDIHRRLARGEVYFHTVVVPEGYTMFDIARAIEAAGLGSAGEFLKVAKSDTALIADLAPGAHSLEGYLFPDTYEFSRMMTMQDVAAAMVKQFRQVAHQIGLAAGSAATSETPESTPPVDIQRTVIMASIVEKETAVAEERPLVASVYYNRLAKNIALDADPSIIYAELLAGTYGSSRPTIPIDIPASRPVPSRIPAKAPSKPRCIPLKVITTTSSPMPPDTTASRAPWKITTETWQSIDVRCEGAKNRRRTSDLRPSTPLFQIWDWNRQKSLRM